MEQHFWNFTGCVFGRGWRETGKRKWNWRSRSLFWFVALNIISRLMTPKLSSPGQTSLLSTRFVYTCSCLLDISTWMSKRHQTHSQVQMELSIPHLSKEYWVPSLVFPTSINKTTTERFVQIQKSLDFSLLHFIHNQVLPVIMIKQISNSSISWPLPP